MKRAILLALLIGLPSVMALRLARADSIDLKQEGGTFVIPVLINDKITLDFMIDSGAADVSIPADVFSTLTRTGTVSPRDLLDKQEYVLADGSKQQSQRFRIRSLRIGAFELRNVIASVAPRAGSLLLGQSFLSRLQSWSIDNQRQALLINRLPASGADSNAPHSYAAPPSNWVTLGMSTSGQEEIFVDTSSIRVAGDIRRTWIKMVYSPQAQKDPTDADAANDWWTYQMGRVAFNCDEETWSLEAVTTYHANGDVNVRPSAEGLFPTPWAPVAPGTAERIEIHLICSLGNR